MTSRPAVIRARVEVSWISNPSTPLFINVTMFGTNDVGLPKHQNVAENGKDLRQIVHNNNKCSLYNLEANATGKDSLVNAAIYNPTQDSLKQMAEYEPVRHKYKEVLKKD